MMSDYQVTRDKPRHGTPKPQHWVVFTDGPSVYVATVTNRHQNGVIDVYLSLPTDEIWKPIIGLYYGVPGFGRIRTPYSGRAFRDIIGKCYDVGMKEINENWWPWLNHV